MRIVIDHLIRIESSSQCPTDMPSLASENSLSMRRVRSDNTPCQIGADGQDEGVPFSQPIVSLFSLY
jgi:hypothetical protein